MKRVTIIGLGLIGGSLGQALKQARGDEVEIVGYARNPEKATKARLLGVIDRGESSLSAAVEKTDLTIIATPVLSIQEILKELGEYLSPGCIVTDTGSTKTEVMGWAEKFLPEGVNFVGGHPMAGKEISGIEAAEAALFRGCTYCLTPGCKASAAAGETMAGLVREIGAQPLFIDASLHDYLVAGISHLPLMISVALVATTTAKALWGEMGRLAAGGYRDVSRLASQDPVMNRDICLTNRQNIAGWIDDLVAELQRLRHLVENGGNLERAFSQARQARQSWLERKGYVKKNPGTS